MLSIKQVADMKGVSYHRVLSAAKRGKLPHRKVGNTFVIEPEDAKRWHPEIIRSTSPMRVTSGSQELLESILQRLTRIETKQHKIADELGVKFTNEENTHEV